MPFESPEEVQARVHFERAVRAELDGRLEDAAREADEVRKAAPGGRFAAAADALDRRLAARRAEGQGTRGVGARVELVVTSTTLGLLEGGLLAGATDANAQGTAGLLMLGTGVGLATSVLATRGHRVPSSAGPMLSLGAGYGAFALGMGLVLADTKATRVAGSFALAVALGGAAGLGTAYGLDLTAGDSGAASQGAIFGALLPTFIGFAVSKDPGRGLAGVALAGSTIGLVTVPILNRTLGWNASRSRWTLIGLGGGVGLLAGFGTAVLAKADQQPAFAIMTLGTVAGLALTAALTSDLLPDEERHGASALLELRPGRGLRTGDALSAVAPALLPDRAGHLSAGVQVRALEARF